MPPKRKIKPDPDAEPEMSDSDEQLNLVMQAQELDNALNPKPQKRGRAVGSGAGEKRKSSDEYSNNPHTIRANKRLQKMTESEAKLHRVKNNLASAKSKARKKVRESEGFSDLPKSVQIQKLKEADDSVQQVKEQLGYTPLQVRSDLENQYLALQNEITARDLVFVSKIKREQYDIEDDDPMFYADTDDEDDEFDENNLEDAYKSHGTIAEAISAGLDDFFLRDVQIAATQLQNITGDQVGQDVSWTMFKASLIDRIKNLAEKEHHLRLLGSELNDGWVKLILYKRDRPETYFDNSDKALLRFAFALAAASDDMWIDLPGPAEWWPDILGEDPEADKVANAWYIRNGFQPQVENLAGYWEAAQKLKESHAPQGYLKALVHDDGELIWNPYWDLAAGVTGGR